MVVSSTQLLAKEYKGNFNERADHCNRVLKKALDMLDHAIREGGGLLTHDRLPRVVAEEIPLVLLFQNVIANAQKYRPTDEPVRIQTSAQHGAAIEAEHLKKIFVPFKRLHGSEYPGSGIGLAICQITRERSGFGRNLNIDSDRRSTLRSLHEAVMQ